MVVKKTNWFVRTLIIILCLFLSGLVGYRFFTFTPQGDFGLGIITVLMLIVVLVLSESFDNFSIGKLLSLSREVENKVVEVTELKRENLELRSQIVTIASNFSQHQASTNIVGLPNDIAHMYSVTPASVEEVQEKQREEQSSGQIYETERPLRTISVDRLKEKAIAKFLELNNLQQFPVARNTKLMTQIEVGDPISAMGPFFAGYLNTLDAEIFIDIEIPMHFISFIFRDRLYMMLSKLYHYRVLKKSNVFLVLILTTFPEDKELTDVVNELLEDFQPAITKGLLKIVEIKFTESEYADLHDLYIE